jgi:drug/metabolite transporter (DMT)-like permease
MNSSKKAVDVIFLLLTIILFSTFEITSKYFAKPALATLLAAIVLGEPVGLRLIIGIIVIGAGIIIAQRLGGN